MCTAGVSGPPRIQFDGALSPLSPSPTPPGKSGSGASARAAGPCWKAGGKFASTPSGDAQRLQARIGEPEIERVVRLVVPLLGGR